MRRIRFRLVEIADTIAHHIPLRFGRGRRLLCDYYDRLLLGDDPPEPTSSGPV